MNRAAVLISLLCLGAPLAVPHAIAATLSYKLYVMGFPVADAALNVDLAAPAYQATLRFHTTGLADVVSSARLQQAIRGRFDRDWPAPAEYSSNGRIHGQDRVVDMSWRDGNPIVTSIAPGNETEREDVPVALRAHTIDPLSLIVLIVHLADQTGRCDGTARGYDGRQLELFEAHTAGEDILPGSAQSSFSGRALRCAFIDHTLAGFRFGTAPDEKLRAQQGTIWLSRILPGGPRLPVRASIETRWLGYANIYLTSVAP